MSEFLMPSLGADMEAGKLVEWLVGPGAPVKRGDIVAVVETQKGAIEIETFEDGVFERSLVEIGETVPVGTAMAIISRSGEAQAPAAAVEAPAKAEAVPSAPSAEAMPVVEIEAPVPEVPESVEGKRLKVSPAARRLAQQSGIDISDVQGSGPGGAILLTDIAARTVKTAEAAAVPAPAEDAMIGMRAAIAAAMARSKREIPHYYLSHTLDLTAAQDWLTTHNTSRSPADRLLMGVLFVKAVALATRKYPEFNGFFEAGAFAPSPAVHAGVAINIRGGGLVAPAIHNTDELELDTLMQNMRDLVTRVRAGRFRGSELADPTITISSLGERGVESLYGVIYPPQTAIVGFGMPVLRPWVVDGMIGPRLLVTVTLAGDHRVSDGHRGALFLNSIEHHLLEPETL